MKYTDNKQGRPPAPWGRSKMVRVPLAIANQVHALIAAYKANFKRP